MNYNDPRPEDNDVRTVDITKEPPCIINMEDTWFAPTEESN